MNGDYIRFIQKRDDSLIEVTTSEETCSSICQSFVDFMRAVGFHEDGIARALSNLDIVADHEAKLE